MGKQVLSIEQMEHLQELGLDTRNASMCHIIDDSSNIIYNIPTDNVKSKKIINFFIKKVIHVYTIQDILDMLPIEIEKPDGYYFLSIDRLRNYWFISYIIYVKNSIKYMMIVDEPELIDAAYSMLCWCIENGYVKTNKEDKE